MIGWDGNVADSVLGVLATFFGFIVGLLPEVVEDLGDWNAGVGTWLISASAPVRAVLPLDWTFVVIAFTVTIVWPAVLVYRVTFWIYKHLPWLGKG